MARNGCSAVGNVHASGTQDWSITGVFLVILRRVAARAADLAVRETRCCSFFGFAQSATGGDLTLDITAPPGQVAVLGALVDRARFAAGLVPR